MTAFQFQFDNVTYVRQTVTEITVRDGVDSIPDNTFKDCKELHTIVLPISVTTIGNRVFSGCSSLVSINIPNSVTTIAYGVFYGCTSLVSITIPNSLTTIGNDVFEGCSSLISKCGNCNNDSVLSYFRWEMAFQTRAAYLLCLKTTNEQYVGVRIPRLSNGKNCKAFVRNEDGATRAGELNIGLAFAILNDDVWSDILQFV